MVLEEAPVGIAEIQRASDEDVPINAIKKRVIMHAWRDRSVAEEPYYLVREQISCRRRFVAGQPLSFRKRYDGRYCD